MGFRKLNPETIHTYNFDITADDIKELLVSGKYIPDSAKVDIYVEVPRGGDYSGMQLDLSEHTCVKVRVTEIS